MTKTRNPQRGFTLIIALIALTIVLLIGATAIQTIGTDTQTATSDRQSREALYIAQAGVAAAMDQLRTTHNLENPTVPMQTVLDQMGTTYAVINDAGLSSSIHGWYGLTATWVSFGVNHNGNTGRYWIAVRDDDDDTPLNPGSDDVNGDGVVDESNLLQDTNNTILVRALAEDATGVRKLIEVSMGTVQ